MSVIKQENTDKSQQKHYPVFVIEDTQGRRVISLDKNIYSLGRSPTNSIILNSKLVSRHHATLLRVTNSESKSYSFQIIDGDLQGNHSTNGLIINSKPCLSKLLQDQDLIYFGSDVRAKYFVSSHNLLDEETLGNLQFDNPLIDPLETFITSDIPLETFSEEALVRLASFPELLPIPIIEIDIDGKITYLNPVANAELTNIYAVNLEHPVLAGLLVEVKNNNQQFFRREIQIENTIFEQSVHYIAESRLIRSYLIDITERKQAEAHIHQLNAELEKRVQKRTQELLNSNTQLEAEITKRKQIELELRNTLAKEKELSELKSRFITMASHEFRTPLTTILGSAESLEHYSKKWSDEKKNIYLKRIQETVKYMTTMLDDVLLMGKIEAGKLEFNPKPLLLEKIFGELVEEMRLSNSKHHLLKFINHSKCGYALLDEKLLRQIIGNLISNAIKYSPSESTVNLTLADEDELIVFQVQDQGIGIPTEDQERLFEPFHRANNISNIPGTGLGLSIVKKSVEAYGGQIIVESEINVGTKITVKLPLKEATEPEKIIPEWQPRK